MASREKVLQTTELLELILIQLSVKDLLLAQRTSRTFNNLIRTSVVLQQALFFRPRPAPSATLKPASATSPHLHSHPSGNLVTETWERNPLLISTFPPWFDRTLATYGEPRHHSSAFEGTLPPPPARAAFLAPEASWRRMLVAQPAVTELGVARMLHMMDGDGIEEGRVALPQGLTMGVLYDVACQEVLGSDMPGSFRVQWHGGERLVVFFVRHVLQCCSFKDEEEEEEEVEAKVKGYFSAAFERLDMGGFAWRAREIGNRVPESVLREGDYECEVAHVE